MPYRLVQDKRQNARRYYQRHREKVLAYQRTRREAAYAARRAWWRRLRADPTRYAAYRQKHTEYQRLWRVTRRPFVAPPGEPSPFALT